MTKALLTLPAVALYLSAAGLLWRDEALAEYEP